MIHRQFHRKNRHGCEPYMRTDEVADALGIPKRTVQWNLRSGMNKIVAHPLMQEIAREYGLAR